MPCSYSPLQYSVQPKKINMPPLSSSLRQHFSSSLLRSHGFLHRLSHTPSSHISSQGCLENLKGGLCASALYALSFRNFIHSSGWKDFEKGRDSGTGEFVGLKEFETGRIPRTLDFGLKDAGTERNSRTADFVRRLTEQNGSQLYQYNAQQRWRSGSQPSQYNAQQTWRNSRPMDFVRGIIQRDGSQFPRYNVEQNAHFVHIKLLRNNTHVSITDNKGNPTGVMASSGWVPELKAMKGAQKQSRYTSEATCEHLGRKAREMGLKSVVVKVNGFTYFKKKKQAILSFREGFTGGSRVGPSPIVYIEDTTQRAHNGCRRPKKRRI